MEAQADPISLTTYICQGGSFTKAQAAEFAGQYVAHQYGITTTSEKVATIYLADCTDYDEVGDEVAIHGASTRTFYGGWEEALEWASGLDNRIVDVLKDGNLIGTEFTLDELMGLLGNRK